MSSRVAWPVFDLFLGPWMAAHLRVHLAGLGEAASVPDPWILLCANHESFWDGFLLRALQRRIRPSLPFHAVMLGSELSRRPWLAALGAIPIEPGSLAGGRRMLRAVRALREREEGGVLAYFPQGRIRPGDPRRLDFRPGVTAVAKALSPARILPVGIRLYPGRTRRMEAFLSVGPSIEVGEDREPTVPRLEDAVAAELDAIRAHVAEHGEEAADRWPPAGESLPRMSDPSWISYGVERWISKN